MKKLATLLAGAAVLMAAGGAMATTITYSTTIVGNEFTSPYTVQVETFDAASIGPVPQSGLLWNWSGNASVLNASISGQSAAPFGNGAVDASTFISVPNPASNGTVVVTELGGLFNYFGLWWGSVDNYNTLKFYNGNTLVGTFTGSDVLNPGPANGNQTAPTSNLYVNFLDLPLFDSFEMTSSQFAFEADNIAVGNVVPEPGTMVLLGAGLLGLAIFGKRRMNQA